MIYNEILRDFDKIDVFEVDDVKEIEIFINNKAYLIRLDYNSLINIAEKTNTTFDEMFYEVFINNKGLYNYLLEILTYCCVNEDINDKNFFRNNLEPSAENILMLEDVMKYLASEVFDTETMTYIENIVKFKYLKTDKIEINNNGELK